MRHDSGRHAEVAEAGPANSFKSIDAEVTASVGLHPGGMFVAKRLFVGNLPHQVSSADLNQLFSEFGTVQSVEESPPDPFCTVSRTSRFACRRGSTNSGIPTSIPER
jgi:RNA recognition motif-containing protein